MVRELVSALVATEPGIALDLFVAGVRGIELPPPPGHSVYHPTQLSERNLARMWHRLRLPIPVEYWTGALDVFHAMDFTLPPTHRRTQTIVTIHDLAFERFPDETMPGMLAHLKRTVPRSVARADHLMAVSQATARDLIDLYGVPEVKISVVHLGVAQRFNPRPAPSADSAAEESAAIRQKYGLGDGALVLTVSTLQPRKNHKRLVQAFAQASSDATLVIAGAQGWAYEDVQREVDRLNVAHRVVFAGRIDEADLPALYRAATVFVYPSLYEGFGLPVLEAMACGLPVISSDSSSLPEVVGEAGILVDPLDVAAISGALDRVLGNDALRAQMRQAGITQARQFTWAQAAQQTWDVYEQVLKQ